MYQFINSNKSIYKNSLSGINDASLNASAVRIYRDITTDIYTDTFLKEGNELANFLDYTFHLLYSLTIPKINENIIEYNDNNPTTYIKPVCGPERVYLIFKGGTLMNKFFLSHITTIKNKYKDTSSTNVSEKYNINLSKFDIDLENDTSSGDNTDTFSNFSDNILKKKFAISDTDYSLVIHTFEHDRFNIIYQFAINALAKAFDIMNDVFEEYYNSVLDPDNELNMENSINSYIPNTTRSVYNGTKDYILEILRYDIFFGDDIKNKNNLAYNLILDYIRPIPNEINTYTDIYYLYDTLEIINLLIYMQSADPQRIEGIDLNHIRDILTIRIELLVEKKLVNLKNDLFYTYTKINQFKMNMLAKYINIQDNQETNKAYYTEKIERFDHPAKEIMINKYVLNKNNNYTLDSFQIKPRKSVVVTSNSNPIIYNRIKETVSEKIHYSSFNTLIRKVKTDGSVTDFDLIRTKFNVEFPPGIIKKNGEDSVIKIPSEFIDVSIPRYDEASRKSYFDEIKNNNLIPYMLNLVTSDNRIICVYSYSPSDISHDLQYVLVNQNTIEPWLDQKYAKRVIRLILFIILASYIDARRNRTLMANSLSFCELCSKLFNYAEGDLFPYTQIAKTIDTVNYNAQSLINMENYVKIIHENIFLWINQNVLTSCFVIKKDFDNMHGILINVITWGLLYGLDDANLLRVVDITSDKCLQKNQYTINTIGDIRLKFKKMIQILFDYGFKLHYVYSLELEQNQQGGKTTKCSGPSGKTTKCSGPSGKTTECSGPSGKNQREDKIRYVFKKLI